jgi:nucleotide-binding universal stress UspA family protein
MSILVPVDLSDASERALAHADQLAGFLDDEIIVLVVIDEAMVGAFRALAESENTTERLAIKSQVDGVAQTVKAPVRVEVIEKTGVAQTIIDSANDHECRLIVMASRGRSGVQRWMLGSVAEKVVRASDVPVMIVPIRA